MNLSQNIDRSPNTTSKNGKKLAGVLAPDDISLPPLASRTKIDHSNNDMSLFMNRASQPNPLQPERLSAKPANGKK